MKRIIIFITTFCVAGISLFAQTPVQGLCRAYLHNDTLTLENDVIFQHYLWNEGNLIRLAFGPRKTGKSFIAPDKTSIFGGRKTETKTGKASFNVTEIPATRARDAFLKVEIDFEAGNLSVKRVFRIVPGCPAVASEIYLKGNISGDTAFSNLQSFTIDRVKLESYHWIATSAEFFDMTDRTNTLVQTYSKLINRSGDHPFRGNLMLLSDGATGNGIFLLKESPTSNAQLSYLGFDFMAKPVEVDMIGTGVKASEINDSIWTRAYGAVIGISLTNNELGLLTSLRQYQSTVRKHIPGRDNMIMMNTWGDLSRDLRVGEEFCLNELEAAAKYSITHFQIDDGWQTGRSGNTAFKDGPTERTLTIKEYWEPDPEKFPEGLTNVVKKGKELGIEVCLWFIPLRNNTGESWKENADVLINLYKKYGIRTFKIDAVNLPDKQADVNFRKFLDAVSEATNYDVVFNLDVTTGKRGGYHYFNEYGNIFLENRFTDWHNSFTYFPYSTLRNLWMLSRFVPPQILQIEFLNKWRNEVLYKGDPLAPANYSFDYVFAITMMAQPLAWFEATNLPEEAMGTAPLIMKYREIQEDLHKGIILPIGNEPNGNSWTGFQSVHNTSGYFLVFRENHTASSALIKTWLPEGSKVNCIPLMGNGKAFTEKVGFEGSLPFTLPNRNSFALYKYSLE